MSILRHLDHAARRLLPAALGLLVGLGALLAAPAGASAVTPSPAPSAVASTDPSPSPSTGSGLTVRLDRLSPQVLALGEDLQVQVTVTNSGATTVARGTVSLELRRVRLATRSELTAWGDGTAPATGTSVIARAALPGALQPGQSVSVPLTASAPTIQLANVWGPRGLLVRVTTPGAGAQLRTFLLWRSNEQIPQAQVAFVAPVVGPTGTTSATPSGTASPTPAPTPTAAVDPGLAEAVSAHGRLARLLATARSVPQLGLAVDPALLAAAESGGQATAAWASGVESLLADGRDAIALPWSDPDVAALGQADRTELLTSARARSTATRSTLSGDLVWTGPGALDSGTAQVVRRSGATRLLVPGSSDTPTSRAVQMVRTNAGEATVLTSDARLDALATGPDAGTTASQLEALAILSIAARDEDGGDRVVVAATRDWSPDPASTASFVDALLAAPWVRFTTTADLVTTGRQSPLRLPVSVPTPAGLLGPGEVGALSDESVRLHALAAATREPAAVTTDLDPQLLAPLAVAYRSAPATRSAQVAAALGAADSRLAALSLAPRGDITVISASSEVRFTVRNDLAADATVRIRIRPAKACLSTTTSAPVVVPAGSQIAVPVSLAANANCRVEVAADLLASDGTSLSAHPLVFKAQLSPTIENVGTAIVGALLAIGLVLGIGRTVRRGQSARRGSRRVPEDEVPALGVLGGEPTVRHGGGSGAPPAPDPGPRR